MRQAPRRSRPDLLHIPLPAALIRRARVAVEQAAGATRWINLTITETLEEDFRQERRGRRGIQTRYRKTTRSRFHLSWEINTETINYDAVTDGMFPLISNDRQLEDPDVLTAYRYQPNLERRHHLLKSSQQADPLLLHDPARIEALFCCHFLALLTSALIEREIRTAMANAGTSQIPLYPELRACTAPSAARILELFSDLTRHQLRRDNQIVQTFHPELSPLQEQVLKLLKIPTTSYTPQAPTSCPPPHKWGAKRSTRSAERQSFDELSGSLSCPAVELKAAGANLLLRRPFPSACRP